MDRTANRNRMVGIGVTAAMASILLGGCASAGGGLSADLAAGKAEAALAKGKHAKAISLAESSVALEPHNREYRYTLGLAYLEAGRFASATTAFDDAMRLGDNTPRTALSLTLALIGQGKLGEAAVLLDDWQDTFSAADAGLAYTLTQQPGRGIHILENAIRAGDNTPKTRQNLAYSYAMAGRWREARVMAAQDVPIDQLGARLEEWAMMTQPQAWQRRVAALLNVPAGAGDSGQPAALALADDAPQMEMAEAAPAPPAELPPIETDAESEGPLAVGKSDSNEVGTNFSASFSDVRQPASTKVRQDSIVFTQVPVIQPLPGVAKPVAVAPRATRSEDTHLVQLGSFTTEKSAHRAWEIYLKRYPGLTEHRMVLDAVTVNGKRYWRVGASGYDQTTALEMCSKVKASGSDCLSYAHNGMLRPSDGGPRIAHR